MKFDRNTLAVIESRTDQLEAWLMAWLADAPGEDIMSFYDFIHTPRQDPRMQLLLEFTKLGFATAFIKVTREELNGTSQEG